MSRTKPIIATAGGKSWALKHLLPMIPEHRCYVEAFGGGLALFFAKPPSALEVINDIDSDLVNLYRCVRFHEPELAREMDLWLNSREEFNALQSREGLTDIQRAARFLFIRKNSFGGKGGGSFGRSKSSGSASLSSIDGLRERLRAARERLDRVVIENVSWDRLIDLYDAAETFFFFDPPYVGCSDTSYRAWTMETLGEFAERLATIKAAWILTINDSKETRALFKGHRIKAVERQNGIENRAAVKKNARYKELIIRPK